MLVQILWLMVARQMVWLRGVQGRFEPAQCPGWERERRIRRGLTPGLERVERGAGVGFPGGGG